MIKRVLYQEPPTIARVALFEGDLEKTIAKFSPNFFRKPDQPQRLVYGLLCAGDNPYMMNIAHNPRKLIPPENYNSLLLITSRSHQRNLEVLEEFQHRTGMDFQRRAPEETKLHFKVYDLMLTLLETRPEETMDFLRELIMQS